MKAKKQAEEERFPNIARRDDENGEIFKMAKQMARTNQDVVEESFIRNNQVDLVFGGCNGGGKENLLPSTAKGGV